MSRPPVRPRGFTLVELLVVLGIIALLMALLTPAVMWAINAARRTRMGVEIAALNEAIEKYKTRVGDYPPNFRDYNAFIRHVRTRYPKIALVSLNEIIKRGWGTTYDVGNPPAAGAVPLIDEGESLVLWLALTRNDPQYPFNPAGTAALQSYYEFDQRRLVDADSDGFPSYRAAYAKDTFYLYLDSRSYDELLARNAANTAFLSVGAYGEDPAKTVRPYVADLTATAFPPPSIAIINPTSFQVICAGQDGEFGIDPVPSSATETAWKGFPGGQNYDPEDRDNITNFSEGRTLEDHIP